MRLPKEIRRSTVWREDGGKRDDEEFLETAPLSDHEGSHTHICHELITCILEDRPSIVNEDVSANITAAGICAHTSAMKDGEKIKVPEF